MWRNHGHFAQCLSHVWSFQDIQELPPQSSILCFIHFFLAWTTVWLLRLLRCQCYHLVPHCSNGQEVGESPPLRNQSQFSLSLLPQAHRFPESRGRERERERGERVRGREKMCRTKDRRFPSPSSMLLKPMSIWSLRLAQQDFSLPPFSFILKLPSPSFPVSLTSMPLLHSHFPFCFTWSLALIFLKWLFVRNAASWAHVLFLTTASIPKPPSF